jgi:hypothetical protein
MMAGAGTDFGGGIIERQAEKGPNTGVHLRPIRRCPGALPGPE